MNAAVAPVGVVLAGGASRRFGRDKATLVVGGETLVARAAARLARCTTPVAIADAGRALLAGALSLPDGPGRGPAAGLLGAARAFPARSILVLACDLPDVPSALLADLSALREVDLALPRWAGGVEPLAALYGPAALARLEERVARGDFAIHRLAEERGLTVRWLEEEWLRRFGDPAALFRNINTPDDLSRVAGDQTSSSTNSPPHDGQGQSSRSSSKR